MAGCGDEPDALGARRAAGNLIIAAPDAAPTTLPGAIAPGGANAAGGGDAAADDASEAAREPSEIIATFELRAFTAGGERAELRDGGASLTTFLDPAAPWSVDDAGLWLARKLVEKLGGQAYAKDGGATLCFRVRLTLAQPVPAYCVVPQGITPSDFIVEPSILIVCAMPPLREVLRRYVEAWGFSADDAGSMQRASERLKERCATPAARPPAARPPARRRRAGPARARRGLHAPRYYMVVLLNLSAQTQTPVISGTQTPGAPAAATASAPPHALSGEFAQLMEMKKAPAPPRASPIARGAPPTAPPLWSQEGSLDGMLLIVMSPAGLSLKEPFGEKFGGGWQARSRSLLPPIESSPDRSRSTPPPPFPPLPPSPPPPPLPRRPCHSPPSVPPRRRCSPSPSPRGSCCTA